MSKKILLLLILSVFVLNGCGFNKNQNNLYNTIIQRDNMIVGISIDSKPFGFKGSDGKIKGIEADLAREIANKILGSKDKVTFKNITSQDRIKAVISGDVDMVISTMTITPERKKIVNFSDPYYIAGQVICVRKDSKINSLDDLMNKRIIVILGTTGEENIRRFAPNALIQGYSNNIDALNAFKEGSDDAITTDDSLLHGFVIENEGYMILPIKLTEEPYGIAFKKSNQANLFKQNINKIINEIRFNGTFDSIKDKWGID